MTDLIAYVVLFLLASLRQDSITCTRSFPSSESSSISSGVKSMRVDLITCPCDGRESCSKSCVTSGSVISTLCIAIVVTCIHQDNELLLASYRIGIPHPKFLFKYTLIRVHINGIVPVTQVQIFLQTLKTECCKLLSQFINCAHLYHGLVRLGCSDTGNTICCIPRVFSDLFCRWNCRPLCCDLFYLER